MQQVESGMNLLKKLTLVNGEASLGELTSVKGKSARNLLFGGQEVANNFEIVDETKSISGGTATIFAKHNGDFIRISTNVQKGDGSRAIGTILNPDGKAIKNIKKGKAYYGLVEILGNPYLTGYEPIFDNNDDVIGIWYTGYLLSSLDRLQDLISTSRILDNGFMALLNDKNKIVFNSSNIETDKIAEIISKNEIEDEEWELEVLEFDKWGYYVVSAYSLDDVNAIVNSANMKTIIGGILVGAMIIGLMAFLIIRMVIKPLDILNKATVQIASGNEFSKVEINTDDEMGELATSFNAMSEKIAQQLEENDELPAVVMRIDKEFNISYVNKMTAELLGLGQKELIGKKCYDHFKTDHCQTENCACFQAMETNSLKISETIAKPHGQDIPIQYTGKPIYDKEGNISGAIEFVSDITKIKNQEKYLDIHTKKLLAEMDKFAQGDLTAKLETKDSDDVIGNLFNGFNRVVKNIREIIVGVSEAVQSTASSSSQISSSTEELAAGSQEQSAQTSDIVSAIDQMTSTIMQTTQHTGSAAEFSKKTGLSAKNGGEVVRQTVDGMNRIAEVVNGASLIVKELGNSSNEIGEIVQVINDIADQTNLLALNAAIEAARAGEQGRGFAVVADEVRKLAERTTKATEEISKMILQIQQDTGKAVDSMEGGTKEVELGKELANKAILALDDIIDSSNETIDVVNQVAAASEEQSSAAEQISTNIEGISNVTHESVAGIQQVARASEDLTVLTENLQEMIKKFKIDFNEHNLVENSDHFVRSNGKLIES